MTYGAWARAVARKGPLVAAATAAEAAERLVAAAQAEGGAQ